MLSAIGPPMLPNPMNPIRIFASPWKSAGSFRSERVRCASFSGSCLAPSRARRGDALLADRASLVAGVPHRGRSLRQRPNIVPVVEGHLIFPDLRRSDLLLV